MKLRSGIKLLAEIEGYGSPINDRGRVDAVIKYFRNKGDPLEMATILQGPEPYVGEKDGKPCIAWHPPKTHVSHVTYERDMWLARQADLLPGIYYSILGMKTMGYRHVSIPPHLFGKSLAPSMGLRDDSVIKAEIFVLMIRDHGSAQQGDAPEPGSNVDPASPRQPPRPGDR